MQYETRNETRSRPVWLFILAAILLVLLIVLIGRGCRDEYGTPPPVITDTLDLDGDTTMGPRGNDGLSPDENGDVDGGVDGTDGSVPADSLDEPVVPPGPPAMPGGPGAPAVTPGTGTGM